jgi:hypothetical protein
VELLTTVCPSRQCEDVSFSRWLVCWNSQKHNGNLVGRALGMFGLWFGGRLLEQCSTQPKLGGWCSWLDWFVVCEWVGCFSKRSGFVVKVMM